MDWIQELERLRKEQNPRKYVQWEPQPLHAPSPQPPPEFLPEEEPQEEPKRVIIIDI